MEFPAWQAEKWTDFPENPLVGPVATKADSVIGDPQIILPGEFDDQWHMFCIGYGHFYRFDSPDGVEWNLEYDLYWNSGPTCVTHDGERWIAAYSFHEGWPEHPDSTICARTSTDLVNWSDHVELIAPELPWERDGERIQVRNPNIVILPDGRFRMYYSGGTVMMHDMGFEEPKYIGYAESDDALGPYVKNPEPILRPDPDLWYRNYGAGAMKVFRYGDAFLGMANGIYIDGENHTRSAIDVLLSDDGINWTDAPYNPIIEPSDDPWKNALVYQLDLRVWEGKLRLYYNAREGWAEAKEYIGCSTIEWDGTMPEKLWRLPKR